MKRIVIRTDQSKRAAIEILTRIPLDGRYEVTFREASVRSLNQNRKLWAMLHDIADQVDWYGEKLTAENWKDMMTAALKKSKVVPGIDGGFVVLGQHTSKMSIKLMSELIELISAFGAERCVRFTTNEYSFEESQK